MKHQFPWHGGKDIAFTPAGEQQTQICLLDSEVKAGVSSALPQDEPTATSEEADLTDDEVDRLLRGDLTPLGLTAASETSEHTGAMIALLPTIADQERLAVPGGEDEEELHVTLFYLGEAAKIPPPMRDNIVQMMGDIARNTPIVDGDGFSISTFNPEKPDKETCVTLVCSGDELERVHRKITDQLGGSYLELPFPDQYEPWIPHVTLAYSNDSSLSAQLTDRTGPIRFDVLRVVFAGQATDFPLYDGTATNHPVEDVAMPEPMIAAGGKESDVNKKGGSHNLKDYWVRGEGAAKIGWGTDGSFTRCVAQLGKHVKNPQGLCAEYHHAATGEWPAEKGVESSVEIAVTADAAVDETEYDGGWIGPLAMEDTDTGDGRMFSGGSLTWADTTDIIHPFQWAPANNGEHKGSVTAGRINKIWRDPANPRIIMGQGTFNLNDEDGVRAFNQVKDGYAGGVSIDPDQIADADVELEFATEPENPLEAMAQKPTKTIFHAGRIRGATLVAFPALIEAGIKLTKKGEAAVVASASTTQWKAVEHEMRLGDEIDGLVASLAFAHVHELDDLVSRRQCRFLHHEINEDGSVGLPNLVACANHIAAINAGRTFGLQHQELFDAYQHMAQHFTDADQKPPAFALETEAVVASIAPVPPLAWFGNPNLAGPTPVSVTEDGRVFGHAAAWNSCHTGFADTCVSPPFENDYGYFTTGEVLTAEGHRVAVGQITLGTSHAPTRGLSVNAAVDHYGNTGVAVADVTAGTDDHGIWIAGSVRPGVDSDRLHALRASALSGDWRRIGGHLRMVALLAVNVPGFPIPRLTTAVNAGKQLSLVASGVVDRSNVSELNSKFTAEVAWLAGNCGIPLGKEAKDEKLQSELMSLGSEVFGWNEGDHKRGPGGKFIDMLRDHGILPEEGPKRYGPNGERNFPNSPDEKPTSQKVMKKQKKEDDKVINARYPDMSTELAAMSSEVFDIVDAHGNKHSEQNGKFTGHVGKGGGKGGGGSKSDADRLDELEAKVERSQRKGGKQISADEDKELNKLRNKVYGGGDDDEDSDEGPSKKTNERRLQELEDKADSDSGVNDDEHRELDKLRRQIYGGGRSAEDED